MLIVNKFDIGEVKDKAARPAILNNFNEAREGLRVASNRLTIILIETLRVT